MKFRMRIWYWRGKAPVEDIAGIIDSYIAQYGRGSDGGLLEELKYQVDAQTRALGMVAKRLAPADQITLAHELGAEEVSDG